LIVTRDRGVALIGGLLTGFHEPQASHLDMMRAFVGDATLASAYAHARDAGYLGHEFGDVHLLL
jgi:S-adenosylmethionine:tRNA ribosyltransferase-isomerase